MPPATTTTKSAIWLTVAVLFVIIGTMTKPAAGAPSTPNYHLCSSLSPAFPERMSLFFYEVMHRSAPANFNATFELLALNGNVDTRDAVSAAADARNCDIFLGPTTSSEAFPLSVFLRKPIVTPTATAIVFLDTEAHPFFTRLMPSDAELGKVIAGAVVEYRYLSASVLCSDEPYGRSVRDSFQTEFDSKNGAILFSRCFGTDFVNETVIEATLRKIITRVIVVGTLPGKFHNALIRVMRRLALHRDHVLFFPEAVCRGTNNADILLPGSLCVAFHFDSAKLAALSSDINKVSKTQLYLSSWTDPNGEYRLNTTRVDRVLSEPGFQEAFVSDSARHVLNAIDAYHSSSSNKNKVTDALQLQSIIRSYVLTDAITGKISITNGGERIGALYRVRNVRADMSLATVGSLNSTGHYNAVLATDVYWLDNATATRPLPLVAQPDVRLCWIYTPNNYALSGLHALRMLAPQFPELRFNLSVMAIDGNPTYQHSARAVLSSRLQCDIFLGPDYSSHALAISTVVGGVMLSIAATNPGLSDKKQFPNFARVAASDDGKALALAANLRFYGFSMAMFFCTDDAFGQGAALAFTAAFHDAGGSVQRTTCLPLEEGRGDVILKALENAPLNIVVAMVSCPLLLTLKALIMSEGLYKEYVWTFFELGEDVPGSFTAGFGLNETLQQAYLASYQERPLGPDRYLFNPPFSVKDAYGDVDTTMKYLGISGYVAHDAVKFAMSLFAKMYNSDRATYYKFKQTRDQNTLISAMKNHSITDGISGIVALDEKLDRRGVQWQLFNLHHNRSRLGYAYWTADDGVALRESQDRTAEKIMWLGVVGGPPPVEAKPKFEMPMWALMVAGGAALFVVIIATVIVKIAGMSPEHAHLALEKGLITTCLMIVMALIDAGVAVAAAIVVLQTNSNQIFVIVYLVISVPAVLVGLVTIFLMSAVVVTMLRSGSTEEDIMRWKNRHANAAGVAVAVDHVPMLVLSSVAVIMDFQLIVFISAQVNALMAGGKTGKALTAFRQWLLKKIDVKAQQLAPEKEATEGEGEEMETDAENVFASPDNASPRRAQKTSVWVDDADAEDHEEGSRIDPKEQAPTTSANNTRTNGSSETNCISDFANGENRGKNSGSSDVEQVDLVVVEDLLDEQQQDDAVLYPVMKAN